MPRKSRMDAPGAPHHTVFLGIERRSIFEDDADRDGFLERLGNVLVQSESPCHAWTLMTRALLGRAEAAWRDVGFVLRRFGTTPGEARCSYAGFVAEGKDMGRRLDLVGGGLVRSAGGWAELRKVRVEGARIKGDERIPGSTEFARRVIEAAGEQMDRKALAVSGGLTVETLMARVAEHFNLTASELKSASKVRRVSPARTIFRVPAVRDPGAGCVEPA